MGRLFFFPLGTATMRAGHLDATGLAEAFGIGAPMIRHAHRRSQTQRQTLLQPDR
jgi:hypothetical protein